VVHTASTRCCPSFCSAAAYTLYVAARVEPPPSFVLEWGGQDWGITGVDPGEFSTSPSTTSGASTWWMPAGTAS
jgi:hypothetical protein